MTEDVVTCDVTTSLKAVAERMLRNEIGSVVITNDGSPYGIITESDVIGASYHTDELLSNIPTRDVASHPLITVEPSQSLRFVVKRMQDEQVKKLVVVDRLEVVGIITTQDLIAHYGELTEDIQYIRDVRTRRSPASTS